MKIEAHADGAQQDATLVLNIPRGAAGTDATIEAMRALAIHGARAPIILHLADVIQKSSPLDPLITRLFKWAKAKVVFKRDPRGLERVVQPELIARQIMDQGRASIDCDCLSTLLASFLVAWRLGDVAAFVVVGKAPAPAEFAHVLLCTFYEPARRVLPAGHFGDDVRPDKFYPIDPQETHAPGMLPAGVKRLRVYPVMPGKR